jgi:hypothetical protein
VNKPQKVTVYIVLKLGKLEFRGRILIVLIRLLVFLAILAIRS